MNKITFMFSGQGSQYLGMAKSYYEEFEVARHTFEEASDVLGFDMAGLCFKGGLGAIARAENAQPAILTASVAAYRVFMSEVGIEPEFCCGHSLGEYSALTCAGAISFSDALNIIRQRGILVKEAVQKNIGTMSIIDGIDDWIIEEECTRITSPKHMVAINCYNSSRQTTVAGHKQAVEQIEEAAASLGAHVTPLMASAPIHSPLMKDMAVRLNKILTEYTYNKLKYTVIANVDAMPYGGPEDVVAKLTAHMIQPVRWKGTVKFLHEHGVKIAIEMGPRNVLCNIVKSCVPDMETYFHDKKEDLENICNRIYALR